MPTLYDLRAEFHSLENLLVEQGGEWTEETEKAFARLGELEAGKVDGYQHVIANLLAHADGCREEADRLMEKAQHSLNAVAGLKNRLKSYMEERGTTTLHGERWKAVLQRNGGKPPLTLLVQPHELPPELQRVTIGADTEKIRQLCELGDPAWNGTPVARLEEPGTHLRFR
jgi:hypothetical protein